MTITAPGIEAAERLFPILERKVINRFSAHYSDEELDTIVALMERQ